MGYAQNFIHRQKVVDLASCSEDFSLQDEQYSLQKFKDDSNKFFESKSQLLVQLEMNFSKKRLSNIPYLESICIFSSKFTTLDLSVNQISSLEGYQLGETCERNIKRLNFTYNQIETIQGINSLISNIEEIYLGHNLIKVLNPDNRIELANLKIISLEHNLISSVEKLVLDSANLEFIDLGFNSINLAKIYFKESTEKRVKISLNENNLHEIPFIQEIKNPNRTRSIYDLDLSNNDLDLPHEFCYFKFEIYESISITVTLKSNEMCRQLNWYGSTNSKKERHRIKIKDCGLFLSSSDLKSFCDPLLQENNYFKLFLDNYGLFIYASIFISVGYIIVVVFCQNYSEFEDSYTFFDANEFFEPDTTERMTINTKRLHDSITILRTKKSHIGTMST